MGNSRNKKVIQLLNVFPILSIDGVKSPFNIKWVNILSLVIFPVGIIIYLRAVRFRIGLLKELVTVEQNSKSLMERLIKEKLV